MEKETVRVDTASLAIICIKRFKRYFQQSFTGSETPTYMKLPI